MEKIKRVNVEYLLSLLEHLWHTGVDYVDVNKKQGTEEGEDILGLSFCREYMNEDFRHAFDEFDEEEIAESSEENIEIRLSDDDLNQLI